LVHFNKPQMNSEEGVRPGEEPPTHRLAETGWSRCSPDFM
jgi:hypothetical protein